MISFTSKALLFGIFALSFTGIWSQYQQECHSLDSVIDTLIRNMATINMGAGTAPSCSKSADCTSLSCSFDLMGARMEMKIILSPCSTPPQMTFILHDATGTINLNTNITHQSTFPLPDVGFMKSSLRVDFEPVPNGVQFGLYLVSSTFGVPVTTPLIADQVINTPPCDGAPVPQVTRAPEITRAPEVTRAPVPQILGNDDSKCTDMDDMLAQAGIPTGFECNSHKDCNGFQCNGTIQNSDLQVSLRMDPCSTPVSYNITITSKGFGLDWSHNFTHSENVQIVPAPPMEFRMKVTMNPDPSADTILTTIEIKGCTHTLLGSFCPIDDVILNNQPIPVPPCSLSTSSPSASIAIPTTPNTPSHITVTPSISTNECSSWTNIIHDMEQSAMGLGTLSCNVTANCTGIVCVDMFSNEKYVARLDLRHCVTPVELWMSIKSESGTVDWQRTITHSETFTVPGTNIASFVVNLTKADDEHVELGMDVQFTAFGLSYSDNLIEDQLILVEPCNGTNATTVAMTTSNSVTTGSGKTGQTGEPTMKVSGMTTALIDNDKPNKVPIADDGDSNNVGIVFGVLLAGLVVLCVIAGLLYVNNRRRRYIRADETALVEDSFAEI